MYTFVDDLETALARARDAAGAENIAEMGADRVLAQRVIGLREDRERDWLIALGYPADRPLTPSGPKRRACEEIVHGERW